MKTAVPKTSAKTKSAKTKNGAAELDGFFTKGPQSIASGKLIPNPDTFPPDTDKIRRIDPGLISRSPLNPRTEFDDNYIQTQLAPSIKAKGILQPLLVRPQPGHLGRFEIIIGECRWRAASFLGLESVPAIVRNVTDLELQKLALAENIERKDLSPLEEGRAYKRLLADGAVIAELEKDFGIKRSAIYGRIKLTELCQLALDGLASGELSNSVALRIARIPGKEQQVACAKYIIGNPYYQNDKRAGELISSQYMTELKDAPFDRSDATLNSERGCCDKCTFRTGNQADLWNGEMKGRADVCTDPVCFSEKCSETIKRKLADHKGRGGTVLAGDDAKATGISYGWLPTSSKFVDLDKQSGFYDNTDPENPQHLTWRTVLGEALPIKSVVLVQDPTRNKQLFELVSKDTIEALKKSDKVTLPEPPKEDEENNDWEEQQREREIQSQINKAMVPAMVDAIEGEKHALAKEKALMNLILLTLTNPDEFDLDDIAERREIDQPEEDNAGNPFEKYCKHQTFTEQLGLLAEIAYSQSGWKNSDDFLRKACEIYGVDLTTVESAVRQEVALAAKDAI